MSHPEIINPNAPQFDPSFGVVNALHRGRIGLTAGVAALSLHAAAPAHAETNRSVPDDASPIYSRDERRRRQARSASRFRH
jgi:hypothetical protein